VASPNPTMWPVKVGRPVPDEGDDKMGSVRPKYWSRVTATRSETSKLPTTRTPTKETSGPSVRPKYWSRVTATRSKTSKLPTPRTPTKETSAL
jgi:hypothetical protein